MTALHSHSSWPVCTVCRGTGEENELGEHRLVGDLGADLGALRFSPYESIDPRACYKGPCRRCHGIGRTRPLGWRDPVFDTNGALLDPGSVPELQGLAAFKGLPHPEEEHHGT